MVRTLGPLLALLSLERFRELRDRAETLALTRPRATGSTRKKRPKSTDMPPLARYPILGAQRRTRIQAPVIMTILTEEYETSP
jgi:hypothetical protein